MASDAPAMGSGSASDSGSRKSFQRDPHLWFEDGSVILIAENTGFKVYAGILSQSSVVFRDMFTLPQDMFKPPQDKMTSGPLPTIEMQDKSEDLRSFLRVIHDPSYFEPTILTIKQFALVVSILRVSSKYDVQYLRKRCIALLKQWYPITGDKYIELRNKSRPRDNFARHVSVANVLRETEVTLLLPTALMLACASGSTKDLWDGRVIDEVHYELNDANKRALFLSRTSLSHYARTKSQGFWFNPTPIIGKNTTCKDPEKCQTFRNVYTGTFNAKDDPWLDPFFPVMWRGIKATTCGGCHEGWEKQHDAALQELWEELPSYFGLPDWARLKFLSEKRDE